MLQSIPLGLINPIRNVGMAMNNYILLFISKLSSIPFELSEYFVGDRGLSFDIAFAFTITARLTKEFESN
jgi:hypothetical protein